MHFCLIISEFASMIHSSATDTDDGKLAILATNHIKLLCVVSGKTVCPQHAPCYQMSSVPSGTQRQALHRQTPLATQRPAIANYRLSAVGMATHAQIVRRLCASQHSPAPMSTLSRIIWLSLLSTVATGKSINDAICATCTHRAAIKWSYNLEDILDTRCNKLRHDMSVCRQGHHAHAHPAQALSPL